MRRMAGLPAEGRAQLAASVPLSAPPRRSRGVRPARVSHRRQRHAQRRGGAARRGVADGARAERRRPHRADRGRRRRDRSRRRRPARRAARATSRCRSSCTTRSSRPRRAPGRPPSGSRAAAFASQVRALQRAGYRGVTLRRVWDAWHHGASLPRRPVVLSFDDGYASQVRNALPALLRAGWPGVLNLTLPTCRSRRRERGAPHGPRGLGGGLPHADAPRPDDAGRRRAAPRAARLARAHPPPLRRAAQASSAIRRAATTRASSPP